MAAGVAEGAADAERDWRMGHADPNWNSAKARKDIKEELY
jgi:hypothetical protein